MKIRTYSQLLFGKTNPSSQKPCMSRQWAKYTHSRVSLAEYQYTQPCLWLNFVSGDTFEDMIASLTWPCTLPPGWSVEWDTTPANDGNVE